MLLLNKGPMIKNIKMQSKKFGAMDIIYRESVPEIKNNHKNKHTYAVFLTI